jgi:hypothetical protein
MNRGWFVVVLCCLAVQGSRVLSGWEDEVMAERKGWKIVGPARGSDPVELLVGLKLRNVDGLESLLLEVSDPTSPRYGT